MKSSAAFLFVLCLVALGIAVDCGDKKRQAARPKSLLSENEISRLKRSAEFLVSLQRPDGSFTANTAESPDSAVGQTGYALKALILIHEEIGAYTKPIEAGRRFILQQADKSGLWKYKPFLPADLDDTTAVLAALDKTNAAENAAAEKAIETILQLQAPGGGLRTWLMSDAAFQATGLNARSFRIAEPHAEVMAYFFDFLQKWDLARFRKVIADASGFIAKLQEKNGTWKTVWYRSDLYALNRIVRLLSLDTRYSKNIGLALAYAKRTCHKELGILDSAFCLGVIATATDTKNELSPKLIQRIYNLQLDSGAWPAEPFFFLDISERGKQPGDIKYIQSELYSTAVVVENLMLHYVQPR